MNWLALDIGGANLKVADGRGLAISRPFALWKYPHRLTAALAELLRAAPEACRVAVTMTGELADCFKAKAEGVAHILQCVERSAAGRDVQVYLVTGELVTPDAARRQPHLAAASNWHALAAYSCRHIARPSRSAGVDWPERPSYPSDPSGVLIDIGSTTTDIVPLSWEGPRNTGVADIERLASRELVYTGVRRSPVCALVDGLPWRGSTCPVAQEVFATTADAYVLLEQLPETPDDHHTADGRPLTRVASHARMARMLCVDRDTLTYEEAVVAAAAVRDAQLERLGAAVDHVLSAMPHSPGTIVVSGEGEFLARQVVAELAPQACIVPLGDVLGANASRAAPAHALAVIAREREESYR